MQDRLVHADERNRHRLAARVRRGELVRLHRGIYVPRAVADEPETRAAAALAMVPGAVISHDTAAALWGIGLVHRSAADHVTVPFARRRASRSTLVVHAADLADGDIAGWRGIPVTSPSRTLRDLLVRRDRLTAVWAMEQALAFRLLDRETLVRAMGSRRARAWCALADPRSESPLETGIRLVLYDGGLPRPQVQIAIPDEHGRTRFRIDLGYREYRLGIEADGRSVHDLPDAVYADRWRANALDELGWRLLRFTWRDLMSRTDQIVAAVRASLERPA